MAIGAATRTVAAAVRLLRAEFPDVTASSLRFLEDEGLVHPARSPGGHRLYRDEDIARIRLVKRLQARHYPLESIRRMTVKLEGAADVEGEIAFLESLHVPLSYDASFTPLDRAQLAARAGLSLSAALRLERMGLLFPRADGTGKSRYDEDDLKIAELVAAEMSRGAHVSDFTRYARAMRALVREEFALGRRLAGTGEPTAERGRELKEEADLVHALLRAKLTRELLERERRSGRGHR